MALGHRSYRTNSSMNCLHGRTKFLKKWKTGPLMLWVCSHSQEFLVLFSVARIKSLQIESARFFNILLFWFRFIIKREYRTLILTVSTYASSLNRAMRKHDPFCIFEWWSAWNNTMPLILRLTEFYSSYVYNSARYPPTKDVHIQYSSN